jgi:Tfp pilus assembly protein PilF
MKRARHLESLALCIGLTWFSAGCDREGEPAGGHSPQAVSAMNRGVSAMGQYDYEAAVKAFEEVLKAEPALAEAKVNLAIARFNRARKEDRDIDRATELLDAVLKSDPNNVRALYFKGIVLQHLGQADAAVSCFERVVERQPGDGVAWYLLGMCKQRLGQPCERELLKAVALRPYLGSAYYKLWQVLQAAGQTDKGQLYLEKFKELRQNPLIETVELPQYNQMGELALAQPFPARITPPITRSAYSLKPASATFETAGAMLGGTAPTSFGGAVIFPSTTNAANPSCDLVLAHRGADGAGRLLVLQGRPNGSFIDATAGSGLQDVKEPLSCSMGDIDNDGILDLFVVCAEGTRLFMGKGDGSFGGATSQPGPDGQVPGMRATLLLDADHDGDLDILVCNPGQSGNQLWNNNANGTFTNIAVSAGIACPNGGCTMALAGDLDSDRDTDLVILREGQPIKIFLYDLLGSYHEADMGGIDIRGELGGVLQDLNGDGQLDLLVLGGVPSRLQLVLGDGHSRFRPAAEFAKVADAAASWGALRGFRVADMDLDGDLDVALFSKDVHLLLNDGSGRFVLQPELLKSQGSDEILGAEVADFDGDCVPDLLCFEGGSKSRVRLLSGSLIPPSTAISLAITGVRERDKRTRSPATPYGTCLTVRTGLGQQSRVFSGQWGGCNQSPLPALIGLGGAKQADYVQFRWPDGVGQLETALASGRHHLISELERKISSCPVLFAWNGARFEFITDFAGIGGLGYFTAPGQYAPPQVLEHVKLEPGQLVSRDHCYELRITEPMEETAYVDQLELLAVDHPATWRVFPDERLAVTGPQPSHDLLVVDQPIFPKRAQGPHNQDCTAQLMKADRVYAFHPELDRRFFGFCRPHTLELDFGDRIAAIAPNQRLFLFLSGFLEYPYSQTAYAASQAGIAWEPIRVEKLVDGRWRTIVPDAGAFGGMARTIAVELTGLLGGPDCRLRLSSNLEIYYDQAFLARDTGRDNIKTHALTLAGAELRYVGFPREYSPDGRLPVIYDYDLKDATAPFRVLRGAYTRYGNVLSLLQAFDDQYVLVAPGDEIAVKFDATRLPAPAPGTARSFILISHAYCKDMDLYTATPQTLEPLPFRGMSQYPYAPPERYPNTRELRDFQQTYNTRLVE